jgi:hypothetical protein
LGYGIPESNLSQNATLAANVNRSCKLLKINVFISQKSLDTPVFRLIRFCQKVLTVFCLRWNYSPLKEEAALLPGGLFVFARKYARRANEEQSKRNLSREMRANRDESIAIYGTLAKGLRIIHCAFKVEQSKLAIETTQS